MKFGITGVSGFVGGAVFASLTDAKHVVYDLGRYVRNEGEVFKEKLDWLLHFGAKTNITSSIRDPEETYRQNLRSTLRALGIARNSEANLLFMSSYVYGHPVYLPIDEAHPTQTLNPYMGSKLASEVLCTHFSDLFHLPVVIFRAFNIYGDFRKPGMLIADLLDNVEHGGPLLVRDPTPRRDYLYIADFLSLINLVVSQPKKGVNFYNVGYGESCSNLEVAETINSLLKKSRKINISNSPRQGDTPEIIADTGLLKATYSWKPKYPLRHGLKETIANRCPKE